MDFTVFQLILTLISQHIGKMYHSKKSPTVYQNPEMSRKISSKTFDSFPGTDTQLVIFLNDKTFQKGVKKKKKIISKKNSVTKFVHLKQTCSAAFRCCIPVLASGKSTRRSEGCMEIKIFKFKSFSILKSSRFPF
jgi:hypothetical protein